MSRKQARKKGKEVEDFSILHVDVPTIQRSGSHSSLLSVKSAVSYGRAVSAFINFTAHAVEINEGAWDCGIAPRTGAYY